MPYTVGARLDRYEIIAPLGAGGMGEVYLARDTRLDRKVALKILPASYSNNADRVRRFEQEAKAISALNHPNIITIYEVGQADGVHFIATEFIEGQTLRRRMRLERINIGEALEISIQVANALAAAHSAGILHRDIKPENVMLRPDGYVKVLDFGLAKLAERSREPLDPSSATDLETIETDPGMVLGTATYMSPEQARAQKLDGRSDLFSLGIVLYEMIAGRSPFHDQTASDVMAAILQRNPLPLSHYSSQATPELERIVNRALIKDRDQRYQSINELLTDLKNLRRNNSFEHSHHSADQQPGARESTGSPGLPSLIDGSHEIQDLETKMELTGRETHIAPPPVNTSATIILSEIKKHKAGAVAAFLFIIVLAVGVGITAYRLSGDRQDNFPNMKLTRLAAAGLVIDAALSPDGKYAAYVVDTGEKRGLWIKQVSAQGPPLQLVAPVDARFRAPTFSRDGNHVFYVMRAANESAGDLYRIPTLGGRSQKLVSGVSSPVTLSPEDSQVAFVREMPDRGASALIIAEIAGLQQRELAQRLLPDSFSVDGPSWSPDNKIIACPVANFARGVSQQVAFVRVADGVVQTITDQSWPNIGRVEWLPDGKGLLMAARDVNSLTRQIWLVNYPEGEARRVTNDLNEYRGLTLTADGSTLATVQITQLSNIWTASISDLSQAGQITSGSVNHDGVQGISWTPDGQIVYTSNASGKPSLWLANADGSAQRQLSADAATNNLPSVTPDGRHIVFNSDRGGQIAVWRIDRDGGNQKQLTFGQLDLDPQASPTWVVFSSVKSGRRTLWKVSIDGGVQTQITENLSEFPVVSPDGKLIACAYLDEERGTTSKITILPFTGGAPIRTFEIPTNPWRLVRWSPDGQALTYVETQNSVSNLWNQPISGGKPKRLTNFLTERISSFAWSRDGKNLALARGVETREIVLISNFK